MNPRIAANIALGIEVVAFVALAGIALVGCTPAQQQTAIADGQLFCAKATATGPVVVALATMAGAPVVVTGAASTVVADACAIIGAIPVTPPAVPSAAPVVAVQIANGALAATTPAK